MIPGTQHDIDTISLQKTTILSRYHALVELSVQSVDEQNRFSWMQQSLQCFTENVQSTTLSVVVDLSVGTIVMTVRLVYDYLYTKVQYYHP